MISLQHPRTKCNATEFLFKALEPVLQALAGTASRILFTFGTADSCGGESAAGPPATFAFIIPGALFGAAQVTSLFR